MDYFLLIDGFFKSLKVVIDDVNSQLLAYGRSHQTLCGTTFSLLIVAEDQYFILHVGDSRIYNRRQDAFTLLTYDDTQSFDAYRKGRISYGEYKDTEHQGAIVKSLGTEVRVAYQFYHGSVERGDR